MSIEVDKKGRLKQKAVLPTPQKKVEKVEINAQDLSETQSDATMEQDANSVITRTEEDEEEDDTCDGGYFDTFTTVNDKDFIPEDTTPYKYKQEELSKLQEISRIFSSMDICVEPIEGKHEGYLEVKSYDLGKHRWHR